MQINCLMVALVACSILVLLKFCNIYLNKFLISCWLSPAFLPVSAAAPVQAQQPPAAADC